MGRADEDEDLRRRGRAKPRHSAPPSIATMYAPVNAATSHRHPSHRTSSKMKMASLMAVMDDSDESKHKRVKVDGKNTKWTPRNASISISSLTTNDEARHGSDEEETAKTALVVHDDELATKSENSSEEKPREGRATHDIATTNGEIKHRNGHGDASPRVKRSMYDFYFPTGRTDVNGGGVMNRSLKRKRRTGRRTEEMATSELDLLRFGVDNAKLVPQGLVDRVDVHMSRQVRIKVVSNHVMNWCTRSGFASSFLQEITTLLAAYYPCNYPTLLDDVLAGFLLQRPEFIHLLLPVMLEKLRKAGDSVVTTKYPVTDALVRMCSVKPGCHGFEQQTLVSTSLLRCLLEHNGDRFVLSPWIAACASIASTRVLRTLWRALLAHRFNPIDHFLEDEEDLNWRIQDPAQQIVELLAEEGKLRVCRLTCGFVELLLAEDTVKKHLVDVQSYLISECFVRAFRHGSTSWSSSLMAEWLERRRKRHPREGKECGVFFNDLVAFLVRYTSKLSLKKPEWFLTHIVRFVLSPECPPVEQEAALCGILHTYMPFVFGGVDVQWFDQMNRQNGYSATVAATSIRITEDLDTASTCPSFVLVRSHMERLIDLLIATNGRTSGLFVDRWLEAWREKQGRLCWGYVYALLVCVCIQDTVDEQSALGQRLKSLTTEVCRSYYQRLSHSLDQEKKKKNDDDNTHDEVVIKFSTTLTLVFHSRRQVARDVLLEVVRALAGHERDHHVSTALTIFSNVVLLLLGKCGESCLETSMKRGIVQKSLVEKDSIASASTLSRSSSVHVLTTLQTLALTQDETGEFTRRVLSSERVLRLFAHLLNVERVGRQQEILLDIMNDVLKRTTFMHRNGDSSRHLIVEELVQYAHKSPVSCMTKAIAVLHTLFWHQKNMIQAVWIVLHHCTKLWCGDNEAQTSDHGVSMSKRFENRADALAELVKAVVLTLPVTNVRDVVHFMEHRLVSCALGTTRRMNGFLLLLVQKLVACDLQWGLFLPVVQLAVCPLAPLDLEHIRMVQLQILKTLCSRLTASRHRPVASTKLADWKRCEELVCNERIQTELQVMVKEASPVSNGVYLKVACHRASIVLAQSILAFTRRLRRQESSIER